MTKTRPRLGRKSLRLTVKRIPPRESAGALGAEPMNRKERRALRAIGRDKQPAPKTHTVEVLASDGPRIDFDQPIFVKAGERVKIIVHDD